MKITITGSLGNISKEIVSQLVSLGHEISVISSQPDRKKQIEQLNAVPLIGKLTNAAFVTAAFRGADAVYTMVPPDFSVPDQSAFADSIHRNYAQAIVLNDIKHAVNLSSIVVAFAGQGPLTHFYNLEERLNAIPGLSVTHLRPAMFYTNFFGSLPLVKQQGIIGHNLPGTIAMPLTHPSDIARIAIDSLHMKSKSGSQVKEVISDVRTGQEIAKLLGDAIEKPLQWIAFSDEQLLAGLLKGGFSRNAAETLVLSAGRAIREGMLNEFTAPEYRLINGTLFEQFAQQYAHVYRLPE